MVADTNNGLSTDSSATTAEAEITYNLQNPAILSDNFNSSKPEISTYTPTTKKSPFHFFGVFIKHNIACYPPCYDQKPRTANYPNYITNSELLFFQKLRL
jgi:hypothetical protein